MSNLVIELLLRLIKPMAAVLLGAIVYFVAVALGEPASIALALLVVPVWRGLHPARPGEPDLGRSRRRTRRAPRVLCRFQRSC